MLIRVNVPRRPLARTLAAAAGILIAGLLTMPMLARADDRDEHRGRPRTMRLDKRIWKYHDLQVPRRLHYRDRRVLRPYYAGRVYYRPHHHYHATYHFPVFVNGIAIHRPHYYCGDHIFLAASVPLPRLAISVGFGTPGIIYEPDYYPVHRHHDHDDCDEDEEDDD